MRASLKQLRTSNWKEHQVSSSWIIVDWSGEYLKQNRQLIPPKTGGCCVYTTKDSQYMKICRYSVQVCSDNHMELTSTGLATNAWKPLLGVSQCDAILFPSSDTDNDALLLVETKYSESDKTWSSYKESAVKQITDTITQLSNRGCPIQHRKLYGLISCPLLNSMGASVFSPDELSEIYRTHKLKVHMGNTATFQDAQNISFTK